MQPFTYTSHPSRIVFGRGSVKSIVEEIRRMQLKRVLVLTTPEQQESGDRIKDIIGDHCDGVYAEARPHTPASVSEEAARFLKTRNIDGVVSVGGGSTIGLGKAMVDRCGVAHIAIPTTYAGSEVTPILGETADGRKLTRSDPRLLPSTVVYDVDLTLTLPRMITVTSAFNAIAHAVEAVYSKDANPITSMLASEGIKAIISGLPAVDRDGQNIPAREMVQYGAWLCGVCLGTVGMSLHHKICHVLGGTYDLPHAALHTAVLPHALAYNKPAIGEALPYLTAALGTEDVAGRLYDLARELGAEMSLKNLGLPETGIEETVRQTTANPYWNPRTLDPAALTSMIGACYSGTRPEAY